MDIASRIENINNNLKNAYDSIEGLGIDIDEKNRNLENLSVIFDEIYEEQPKVTGEGTNIILNNTKKGRIKSTLNGNLSQNTTTGKNIIDYENLQPIYTSASTYSIINNGIRITANSAGTYRVIGFNLGETANLIGKVLRFKCDFVASGQNVGAYGLGYCDANGENRLRKAYTPTSGDTIQMTVDNTNTNIYFLLYANVEGSSSTNDYVDFTNIITTLDNEDMSYEEFTNGPSPNPSFPQPFYTTTGENKIYINGKNRFNTVIEQGALSPNGADGSENLDIRAKTKDRIFINAGDYIFSTDKENINYMIFYYNNEIDNAYSVDSAWRTNNSFTILKDCYIRIMFKNSDNSNILASEIVNPMIYNSSIVDGSYLPYYNSQSYNITLGDIELAKIGNYQDYLYKENNKWYKAEYIKKLILDGSIDEAFEDRPNYTYFDRFVWNTGVIPKQGIATFSNYFKVYLNARNEISLILYNGQQIIINFSKKGTTTVEQFKEWLSTHNVIILYASDTPNIIEITNDVLIEQLNELFKAKSYNEITTINQSNEILPFIINAKALKKDS